MGLKTPFTRGKPKSYKPCSHRAAEAPSPCLDCRSETRSRRKFRLKLVLCLFWPFVLQALDSTIIASAMPWIAADFNRFSQQNWIVSSFNLTSSAFIPFWAQIADVFGRYPALTSATVLMIIGSTLCTAAPLTAFPMLLLGRAFQGVAASGLAVVTRTILADGQSLQESAKNWAIFAFVGGLGYGMGPIIGGYLTEVNWRWCFAINLPIGVVALLVLFFLLRKHLFGPQPIPELDETAATGRRTKLVARLKTIDIGGQALFICGFGLIVLGLTWGGATYPWASAAVLVPLILGVLFCILFVLWERELAPGRSLSRWLPRQRPMMPWHIISTRNIALLFLAECATGISMFSVLYFCSIYFITIKGYSAGESGENLALFTLGLGGGIVICSFLCNRWPRMSWPPLALGSLLEVVSVGLFAYSLYLEQTNTIFGMLVLVGVSIGIRFMGAPLHGIGFFPENRASIIALIAVSMPLGGTIGLTIMTTVFNNVSGLQFHDINFERILGLPSDQRIAVLHNIKMGIVWAYVAVIPLLFMALLCSLMLGSVPVSSGKPSDGNIIEEPYLWWLLFRRGRKSRQGDVPFMDMDHKINKVPDTRDSNAIDDA